MTKKHTLTLGPDTGFYYGDDDDNEDDYMCEHCDDTGRRQLAPDDSRALSHGATSEPCDCGAAKKARR